MQKWQIWLGAADIVGLPQGLVAIEVEYSASIAEAERASVEIAAEMRIWLKKSAQR